MAIARSIDVHLSEETLMLCMHLCEHGMNPEIQGQQYKEGEIEGGLQNSSSKSVKIHQKNTPFPETKENGRKNATIIDSKIEQNDSKSQLIVENGPVEEKDETYNKYNDNKIKPLFQIPKKCPYLDTINRNMLDFDFEKLCSVSLTHINVYACLICGKYFQGRHKHSNAFIHSVESSHFVWINLSTLKFYCLPDNYEILDSSLDDIKKQIKPVLSRSFINSLEDRNKQKPFRCVDGTLCYPGVLGLNNIKETDYMNVILQSLMYVKPFRNFFLNENNYVDINRPSSDPLYSLLIRFGELTRKVWNNANFKPHLSPHEMVQAAVLASKKKFKVEKQCDPVQFLSWILNSLHQSLNWDESKKKSIVHKTFRGKMKVFSKKIQMNELGEVKSSSISSSQYDDEIKITPFLFVPLEIPPPPLFTDEVEGNVIAQVSLTELLEQYNGMKEKITSSIDIKRYVFHKLPKYLIFCLRRFTFNYFFTERNPTIVNFNIQGLDMSDYMDTELLASVKSPADYTYNLVVNIVISQEKIINQREKPAYVLQVYHKGLDKWYEIQDIHVKEIMPQMISISESYIQIWEKQMA